jgi:hypothetical protein
MINSVILNVVIDLLFIYLLYSLLITTIQEIIATRFGFRAKILQRSVFRMLEDEQKFGTRFKSVYYLFKKSGNGGKPDSATYEFYDHPLIKFLGEGKHNSKPAYITKATFSKVLIDMLRGKDVKPGDDTKVLIQKAFDEQKTNWGNVKISEQTLSYLKSIWADSNGDIEKFRRLIENWFDETMDRASDWYKQHIQILLFFIGLAVAVVFNVDTIKIVDKLEKDPKLREQIVQQADVFMKAHPDLDKEIFKQKAGIDSLQAKLSQKGISKAVTDSLRSLKTDDSLELVKSENLKAKADSLVEHATLLVKSDIHDVHHSLGLEWESYPCNSCLFVCILKSLLGWIITALALSLGAPFWFDLLNKLMKLRGAVATPIKDDKEKKQG